MIIAVADTHAALWYLDSDSRLSQTALMFMQHATQNGDQIAISGITLAEMVYLVEKGKITAQEFTQLANQLQVSAGLFVEIPVDLRIARALSKVDVTKIPDMPDRIIAATALHLNVPIISRDGKIKLSALQTIW
jgi:PIN domain nuclease of toxin-antitoxin system